jgi:carboxyl-terminal processing protease
MRRAALVTSSFVAGAVFGTAALAVADSGAEIIYQKLEILAQVIASIENHYVDPVSATDLIYGAARGAVSVLDEHSTFFSPDEYKGLLDETEGEYAGIGVELGWEGELPEIVSVLEGSAAARAGLRRGDQVVAIDGESVSGGIDNLQHRLRGPVGSKVVLSIQRKDRDEPWTFTLIRGWVRVAPVTHKRLADDVLYVQVKSFSRRVASDLGATLDRERNVRGLVLDLRDNPGGLFDEAIAICDLFLADGPIVSAVGRGGRVIERHEAHKRGNEPRYPLAILIDKGSASASEVVAGALADRGRARLFGQRSYGKGSVQSILDLSDGSGLKLTVARYLTPSGRVIDGHGIEPDERVEPRDDDPTLNKAAAWVLSQPSR